MRLGDSKESVRMALDTLRKNKLRSGLTILGIMIGISTVILISSAINGLNTNIDQFVKSLGTNDLWVYRFEPFGRRPTTEELNRKQLTYEDGIAMRSLPHVVAVDPGLTYQNFQLGIGNVSLKHGNHKIQNSIIYGDTTAVKVTSDIELLEGRMWTDSEEARSASVVVLGHDAAEDLFHGDWRARRSASGVWKRTEHAGQCGILSSWYFSQNSSGDQGLLDYGEVRRSCE